MTSTHPGVVRRYVDFRRTASSLCLWPGCLWPGYRAAWCRARTRPVTTPTRDADVARNSGRTTRPPTSPSVVPAARFPGRLDLPACPRADRWARTRPPVRRWRAPRTTTPPTFPGD